MKTFCSILLLTILVSCNYSTNDFETYVNSLDTLKFPIELSPNMNSNSSASYNVELFKKYKHSWSHKPIGVVFNQKDYVGILEFSVADNGLAPLLTTYDNKGNKIDSIHLLSKIGYSEYGQTIQSGIINSDLTISIKDENKEWELDSEYNPIDSTIKTTIVENEYKIEGGKINLKK